MQTLNLIPFERLVEIPPSHRVAHEFCFHIHDQMASMLHSYEASGIHNVVAEGYRQAIKGHEAEFEEVDFLSFLRESGLIDLHRQHIVSHLVMALSADMLHFLYEALRCFEKRKFSVGFALLRKPLKEHLLFLCWLLADEEGFVQGFESDPSSLLNRIPEGKRRAIFDEAIKTLGVRQAFSGSLISDMLYSKRFIGGFERSFQQATHLVTSMGDLLKTQGLSLNFIFDDLSEDYHYEFLYRNLPYVLIFAFQVNLEAYSRISALNERTYSHRLITMMGTYEALFLDGRSQRIARAVRMILKEFLTCIHCEAALKITRKNAPALYLTEHVLCSNCGLEAQVPLYWLFAKGDLVFTREDAATVV